MKFSDLRIKISVNQDLCQTLSRPSSVPSILMFHTHSLWTIYTTATCRDYLRVHAKVSGHFFYEKIPNYTLDITPLVGQVKSQRVSRGKFHENHQYGEVYQASITIDHHDSPLIFHGFSMFFGVRYRAHQRGHRLQCWRPPSRYPAGGGAMGGRMEGQRVARARSGRWEGF